MAGMKRYRLDMVDLNLSGLPPINPRTGMCELHPQHAILAIAPDACDFEPVTIADCWLFSASPIAQLPQYITEVRVCRT